MTDLLHIVTQNSPQSKAKLAIHKSSLGSNKDIIPYNISQAGQLAMSHNGTATLFFLYKIFCMGVISPRKRNAGLQPN